MGNFIITYNYIVPLIPDWRLYRLLHSNYFRIENCTGGSWSLIKNMKTSYKFGRLWQPGVISVMFRLVVQTMDKIVQRMDKK